jgi:hypothetical protein
LLTCEVLDSLVDSDPANARQNVANMGQIKRGSSLCYWRVTDIPNGITNVALRGLGKKLLHQIHANELC